MSDTWYEEIEAVEADGEFQYWVDVFRMIRRRAEEGSTRILLLQPVIFYLRYNS